VAAIEAELREAYLARRWHHKIRQVKAAERRNRQLESEWQRSRADRQRRRTKKTQADAGGRGGGRTEAEATVEGHLGDPAYLAECRHNDEHIAKLLGLDEPRKLQLTDEELNAAIDGDIQREVEARLAARHARGTPPAGTA
jgi:hypothetical protein